MANHWIEEKNSTHNIYLVLSWANGMLLKPVQGGKQTDSHYDVMTEPEKWPIE